MARRQAHSTGTRPGTQHGRCRHEKQGNLETQDGNLHLCDASHLTFAGSNPKPRGMCGGYPRVSLPPTLARLDSWFPTEDGICFRGSFQPVGLRITTAEVPRTCRQTWRNCRETPPQQAP